MAAEADSSAASSELAPVSGADANGSSASMPSSLVRLFTMPPAGVAN
jgi:hypothetical protein